MKEQLLPPDSMWIRHTALDRLFNEALSRRVFSGASLLIGAPSAILYEKTWGYTQWGGSLIDFQTQFDLASLTKPLCTTVLSMTAVQEKKAELDDTLTRFLPSAGLSPEKRRITLRHLLSHSSGFPAYIPFFKDLITLPSRERPAALRACILSTPLQSEPGKTPCYSDLGFILLGMVLEEIFDAPLLELYSRWIQAMVRTSAHHPLPGFAPSGFPHFRPLRVSGDPMSRPKTTCHSGTWKDGREAASFYPSSQGEPTKGQDFKAFAATEYCPWRRRLLRGEVHDENAYTLGGITGHAGLFGTARQVFHQLSLLWRIYLGRISDGPCSRETVQTFWTRSDPPSHGTWALGFDTPSAAQSSAGDLFSPGSVGHLGFTGTSFWLDLEKEIVVILLTNRVYPSRQNDKLRVFRPLLHNLIMESFNGK
ncbi:serine hydrolase [Desulforhabdus sp. TSK]|uniref:serine hydrolase domain-containing protein n=1 Tax=Desulforhabdus sp. TSK TaxID=2925014 RepID=UPI001FC8A6DB|nr:serine hydrolase domain-containing protein [Desulforhabdus sp. TSK]GKT08881.1 serine hydrolase [Desulforhabdus sp. TSK]